MRLEMDGRKTKCIKKQQSYSLGEFLQPKMQKTGDEVQSVFGWLS